MATVNGLRLHYVEAGEPDGPLVLLLHGFPEFWYSWRSQLPALADAGFHAVAPDMRGYNTSAKPSGVASYRLKHLTGDVVELIGRFEAERAAVVGHDWGGVVAWELGHRRPEVLDRLAVLNAPHLDRFERALRSPGQLARSWYALAFQVPVLPELVLRQRGFGWLGTMLRRDPVTPAAFDEREIGRYEEALSRPGALRAALNYYRALFRTMVGERSGDVPGIGDALQAAGCPAGWPSARNPTIDVPTLLLWGERDRALGTELTEGLEEWVPDLRIERLPEASHWVQNDAPERVNELLIGFLSGER
jgi:pimeloyl-ACP methyl ester carboxylesterase